MKSRDSTAKIFSQKLITLQMSESSQKKETTLIYIFLHIELMSQIDTRSITQYFNTVAAFFMKVTLHSLQALNLSSRPLWTPSASQAPLMLSLKQKKQQQKTK